MTNKKDFYSTTVYIGTDNKTAKRKFVRAKSKRELNDKIRKLKAQIDDNKDVYTRAYFGVWADKWLNEVKLPRGISSGTATQYKAAIKHLNAQYEFVELKDIKLSDFNLFLQKLTVENPNTGKPMSKRSLENIKKVAHGVFKYAIANDIAGVTDFFSMVTISKNAPMEKRRALTENEQQWIIETDHRAQVPAMIMMFSGLRRGEVIPLEWSDIDFNRGLISVNKSVDLTSNKPIIKSGGKSENAVRVVPIPPILVSFLKDYRANCKILSKYVCLNYSGDIHTKSSWRKMWDSYILDLNIKYGYDETILKHHPKMKASELPLRIEPFTPHYLRHTFATMLYLQGVDVVSAKQYLGHADIKTTVNIYTDLERFNKNTLSDEYKKHLKNDYLITA